MQSKVVYICAFPTTYLTIFVHVNKNAALVAKTLPAEIYDLLLSSHRMCDRFTNTDILRTSYFCRLLFAYSLGVLTKSASTHLKISF